MEKTLPPSDENKSPLFALARAIETLLHHKNLKASIEQALGLIGRAAKQDRAYMFHVHPHPDTQRLMMSQYCEWVADGVEPQIDNQELILRDFQSTLPRWHQRLRKNEIIAGPVASFPKEERALLEPQGIISLICVPVFEHDHFTGFIGFDNCHKNYAWDEVDIALLRTTASAIGAAISREKALQSSEGLERFFDELVTENPNIAIQGFDAEGKVFLWNRGSEKLFGLSSEESVNRSFFELALLEDDVPAFKSLMQDITSNPRPIQCSCRHKDGSLVTALISLISLPRKNEPSRILCFAMDITEQKTLESQLLRAQRLEAIGSLTGGITHDMNNVLSPLMMAVDILKLQSPESPQQVQLLDTMEKSIQRASSLCYQLLSFARGVEGKLEDVDIQALLEDLVQLSDRTLPKSITIDARIPESLPTLRGDGTQLHQVILNLIVNARDAMSGGGMIQLQAEAVDLETVPVGALGSVFEKGRHIKITVTDTGSGMSPETQLKIFEPFFTTKSQDKGTGLGLSSSLAIIKSHHGWIQLRSGLDLGSTFTLYFPVSSTRISSGEAQGTEVLRSLEGNQQLILVVDDEKDILEVTRKLLTTYNYRVHCAKNGAEALDFFKRFPEIALVITDLMMPVMDGVQAMRGMRKLRPDIPMIATSGLSSNVCPPGSPPREADIFLPKPCASTKLLEAVYHLLSISDS